MNWNNKIITKRSTHIKICSKELQDTTIKKFNLYLRKKSSIHFWMHWYVLSFQEPPYEYNLHLTPFLWLKFNLQGWNQKSVARNGFLKLMRCPASRQEAVGTCHIHTSIKHQTCKYTMDKFNFLLNNRKRNKPL